MIFFDRPFQYLCRKCCFRHPSMGWISKAVRTINCNGKNLKVEAIGTSTISHEDARNKAETLVNEKADNLLATVCRTLYTSTKSVHIDCENIATGKCGPGGDGSGYGESYVSQADADSIANNAAEANALANAVCYDPMPGVTGVGNSSNDSLTYSFYWNHASTHPNGYHVIVTATDGTYFEGDVTDNTLTGVLLADEPAQTVNISITTNQPLDPTGTCPGIPVEYSYAAYGSAYGGPTVYFSTQSYTAQCPFGTSGAEVAITQTADSTISQADADAKALAAATAIANSLLVCTPVTVYSSTKTVSVECPEGTVGDMREATETRESIVSQEDADALATAAATASATALLTCVPVTYTSRQCYTATCPIDADSGGPLTACEEATSTVSQADADALALAAATAAANAGLVCTWVSTQSYTANCPMDKYGESVTRTAMAYSNISQADADAQALATATTAALAALYCTDEIQYCDTQTYTANCPEGTHGPSVTRYCHYCSVIDMADATAQALACAQSKAEADLVCEPD